jgi:hypothetical protein
MLRKMNESTTMFVKRIWSTDRVTVFASSSSHDHGIVRESMGRRRLGRRCLGFLVNAMVKHRIVATMVSNMKYQHNIQWLQGVLLL